MLLRHERVKQTLDELRELGRQMHSFFQDTSGRRVPLVGFRRPFSSLGEQCYSKPFPRRPRNETLALNQSATCRLSQGGCHSSRAMVDANDARSYLLSNQFAKQAGGDRGRLNDVATRRTRWKSSLAFSLLLGLANRDDEQTSTPDAHTGI